MKNPTESEKWNLIKELEAKEPPEDTIQARWHRLNELGKLGKELGLHVDDSDKMVVWQRWAKIKEIYEKGLWVESHLQGD